MSFIPETFKDCAKEYVENAEKVSHSIYKFEFLNCRCTDFFGTQDACSVKWSYFCREIAISGFGEQFLLPRMLNRVRDDENFGDMVPEDIFITCKATATDGKTAFKNFWVRSTAHEIMEAPDQPIQIDQSSAVVGIGWALAILIIVFVFMFVVKKFLTVIKLWWRDRKYSQLTEGKSLDVFVCGAPGDLEFMKQVENDLSNFKYSVKVTSDSILQQNSLSEEFMQVATDVRSLVYVFSIHTIKKLKSKIAEKNSGRKDSGAHDWFESWFDEGIKQIKAVCRQNGVQCIIVIVYNNLVGHKADPTPAEMKIKLKLEEGIRSGEEDFNLPIIEFSRQYEEVLKLKKKSPKSNPNGLYDIDGDYRKSIDKLRINLHSPSDPSSNRETVDLSKKEKTAQSTELEKLVE